MLRFLEPECLCPESGSGRPGRPGILSGAKAKIVEGREYLEKEMAALGCRVYPSQSNFIYFDTGKDPAWIQEQLMEKGIRIGAFEMSRVSVGTIEECKLYIKALKKFWKRQSEKGFTVNVKR